MTEVLSQPAGAAGEAVVSPPSWVGYQPLRLVNAYDRWSYPSEAPCERDSLPHSVTRMQKMNGKGIRKNLHLSKHCNPIPQRNTWDYVLQASPFLCAHVIKQNIRFSHVPIAKIMGEGGVPVFTCLTRAVYPAFLPLD